MKSDRRGRGLKRSSEVLWSLWRNEMGFLLCWRGKSVVGIEGYGERKKERKEGSLKGREGEMRNERLMREA